MNTGEAVRANGNEEAAEDKEETSRKEAGSIDIMENVLSWKMEAAV